jgi:hypothetical protein
VTTSFILWNVFLSALGLAYLSYAKIRKKAMPLIGGLVLLVIPYVTDNSYLFMTAVVLVVFSSYFISI